MIANYRKSRAERESRAQLEEGMARAASRARRGEVVEAREKPSIRVLVLRPVMIAGKPARRGDRVTVSRFDLSSLGNRVQVEP